MNGSWQDGYAPPMPYHDPADDWNRECDRRDEADSYAIRLPRKPEPWKPHRPACPACGCEGTHRDCKGLAAKFCIGCGKPLTTPCIHCDLGVDLEWLFQYAQEHGLHIDQARQEIAGGLVRESAPPDADITF